MMTMTMMMNIYLNQLCVLWPFLLEAFPNIKYVSALYGHFIIIITKTTIIICCDNDGYLGLHSLGQKGGRVVCILWKCVVGTDPWKLSQFGLVWFFERVIILMKIMFIHKGHFVGSGSTPRQFNPALGERDEQVYYMHGEIEEQCLLLCISFYPFPLVYYLKKG